MKAVVFNEYGSPDVLHLTEVVTPTPKDDELLIRVRATTVTFGDILVRNMRSVTLRQFTMPLPLYLPTRMILGFNKPKVNILGAEFAGEVTAIGSAVTRFKVGDEVFAYRGMNMGANAEYVCISENGCVATKPANMSYAEAATVPYGVTMALPILRKVNLQRGQKILINGASGGIGSHALQLAKHFGAEVTGVCGTPRIDFVKKLGADKVIDYTREDFTKNGETYDVILDILGKSSFAACKNSLTPNGIYLLASFKTKHLLQMLWTSMFSSKKVICALASEDRADLEFARELIEAGKLKTVIDKTYPLEQTAEAHRYIESGDKKGVVVITM